MLYLTNIPFLIRQFGYSTVPEETQTKAKRSLAYRRARRAARNEARNLDTPAPHRLGLRHQSRAQVTPTVLHSQQLRHQRTGFLGLHGKKNNARRCKKLSRTYIPSIQG